MSQQPDKRVSLHETPGMGSIDELTIDISDLHRDIKTQKLNFIDPNQRVSEDRNP